MTYDFVRFITESQLYTIWLWSYRGHAARCLNDIVLPDSSLDHRSDLLPGERFSATHQCVYAFGDMYKPYVTSKTPFNVGVHVNAIKCAYLGITMIIIVAAWWYFWYNSSQCSVMNWTFITYINLIMITLFNEHIPRNSVPSYMYSL